MARCCGGPSATKIEAGAGITVTGTGTAADPFIIGGGASLSVLDTTQFNMTLTGTGTLADPWIVSVDYAATSTLAAIGNVSDVAPTNTQVLGYNTATSLWEPKAPTTAASGSVTHDTSLSGDGSGGSPLQVLEDPAGLLVTVAAGLGMTDAGKNQLVRKFATAALRTAASPAPTLNSLTMLDTAPGRVDYWNGSAWKPKLGEVHPVVTGQLLQLSGPYVADMPLTLVLKKISFNTDVLGEFDVHTATDLAGFAGVATCVIQPVGTIVWASSVIAGVGEITGLASTLSTGDPLASQALEAVVTSYWY